MKITYDEAKLDMDVEYYLASGQFPRPEEPLDLSKGVTKANLHAVERYISVVRHALRNSSCPQRMRYKKVSDQELYRRVLLSRASETEEYGEEFSAALKDEIEALQMVIGQLQASLAAKQAKPVIQASAPAAEDVRSVSDPLVFRAPPVAVALTFVS